MLRFTITTPIFYVNAPPHIGHAYTVVAADVLARARRLRGDDVFFLTGTDEHGTKIAEAATAAEKQPQAFADEVAASFIAAWKALDIQYDDFIRTTEPRHVQGVEHALRVLHERGHLYEKSYRGLYCTGCEKFITEKELDAEGKCSLHNRAPAHVEEKNWFFSLSKFLPQVGQAIETNALRVLPEERRNEVLGLFKQRLEDFSVSRLRERVSWGIPLPFDKTQTCYVWVDALLNYLTALGYGSGNTSKLTKYWPADVQIIGQDILKFHAVYWPALLLALGLELPKEIFVHGFFTVNGQKISKSLGNVIDPGALVDRYGADATRYLLLSQFPFGASGDVQAERFDEHYEAILANTIGNLVSRAVTLLQKFSDGKIPDAEPDRSVFARPPEAAEAIPSSPSVFARSRSDEAISSSIAADLDGIVNVPVRLAQELNQYADRTAPWKESDPAKRATALRTLADGIVRLSPLTEPVLPSASAAIQKAFGVSNRVPPSPGTPVRSTDPPVLFPRVTSSSFRNFVVPAQA